MVSGPEVRRVDRILLVAVVVFDVYVVSGLARVSVRSDVAAADRRVASLHLEIAMHSLAVSVREGALGAPSDPSMVHRRLLRLDVAGSAATLAALHKSE